MNHYQTILNYFDNKGWIFNAKIKHLDLSLEVFEMWILFF
jgi:hypothetical protein